MGTFHLIGVQGHALLYLREYGGERVLVCLNFGDAEQEVVFEGGSRAHVVASTHMDRSGALTHAMLRANEGLVVLLA